MKHKKGVIITCAIFAVLGLAFAVFAIGAAFKVGFVLNIEWAIIKDWEWEKFNIMLWSIIGLAVCVIVIIAVLLASDEKSKKQVVRQRKVQQI